MDAISAGVDALYDRVKRHPTTRSGVQVYDGRDIENIRGSFIAIGTDGESDPAGDGVSELAGLSPRRRRNTDTIVCFLFSTSGNAEMRPRREDVRRWFNTIRDILAEDNTLGGAVQQASISSYTYQARYGTGGSSASVEMRIDLVSI